MRRSAFVLLAMLVACSGSSEEERPLDVADHFVIDGATLSCNGTTSQGAFEAEGESFYYCDWACAAYSGRAAAQVTLVFRMEGGTWVLDGVSFNGEACGG